LTFYFDRCFGKRFPEALRKVQPPFTVEYHHDPRNKFHFKQETPDDEWLAKVGAESWIVFSHDQKFHIELAPRKAIEQHRIGCFYLWGANDTKWEKLCCFVRSHAAIVRPVHSTPRPFIYHVAHNCRLTRVQMP
jgi:hypothetical protein